MRKAALEMIALGFSALIILSCGNRQSETQEDALQPSLTEITSDSTEISGQLCGGFTEQRELTEEEMEMFRYVTGTGDIVFTPLSVSTQVVAGINYKFWCRSDNPDTPEENPGHCWITIFKPLPGRGDPRLVSIEPVL